MASLPLYRIGRRDSVILVVLLCLVIMLWVTAAPSVRGASLFSSGQRSHGSTRQIFDHAKEEYTQTIVVASTKDADTSWITTELPLINHAIYIADDASAPLHPPQNKGRETMMYLTYIIDHYYNLSDTTIFTHSDREAWHNNDLFDFDLVRMIRSLSDEHVERVGYFNLRCHHESGCPDHIKPFAVDHQDRDEEEYFVKVWNDLHGIDIEIPETLATACCAQFAASRASLQAVPLERWRHYRQWLLDTPLDDGISGRIWEFTWQFVLTGQPVVCPAIEHCYCGGYRLCFQGEGEILSWMAMKEIEGLAKATKEDLEERGKDTGGMDVRLWQRIQRPMLKWIREAELRGRDPVARARLSGIGRY